MTSEKAPQKQTPWEHNLLGAGHHKDYLNGLIRAHTTWAMSGDPGYILTLGALTFKKHFKTQENAQDFADTYIADKINEALAQGEIKDLRKSFDYVLKKDGD